MNKTILTFLFLFGLIVGAFFYLESTYFFEKSTCINNGGGWNYTDNICATDQDIEECHEDRGKWIYEENLCDYGTPLNIYE